MNFSGKTELVKSVQEHLGLTADGIDGPKTWAAISERLNVTEQNVEDSAANDSLISDRSLKLIIDYEVGGGQSYYNRALKRPCWPGGASGVTIGIGYDLGYNSLNQFKADWGGQLNDTQYDRLAKHLGKKGSAAKSLAVSVKDIEIPWEAALSVFKKSTLPRFVKETQKAFPGSEKLHPDAFGVLVSLVFNRGGSLSGSSRVEMLNISKAIKGEIKTSNLYSYIADQIISMKRLWVGKGLDGLLRRRNEEASIIRNCA